MARAELVMDGFAMKTWIIAVALGLLADCCASAARAAVPAAAMNKTITVSFTVTGLAKDPQTQRTWNFSTAVTRIIYVSSAGRLFMRHSATQGRDAIGGDYGPGSRGNGNFSFQGTKLVGVTPFAGGARQITINFDAGFSSCTASIIEGHAAGGAIERKAPNGQMRELLSVSTSPPSCSIQSGNLFAE
jgi:hypothetical protein